MSVRLEEATDLKSFARHQTFPPRYGWFRKAFIAAAKNPSLFPVSKDNLTDVAVELGVGKNMVRSIAFWGEAAKLLTHAPLASGSENSTSKKLVPSNIGHVLFSDEGLDPFLENPGTLWVIHWLLICQKSKMPAWWIALNLFTPNKFERAALIDTVINEVNNCDALEKKPSSNSIHKDMNLFFYNYLPKPPTKAKFEDLYNCPLRELGLLDYSGKDKYRFISGIKRGLTPEILTYIIFDYISRLEHHSREIPLASLESEPGSPGRILKIDDDDIDKLITEYQEENSQNAEKFGVYTSSGVRQLRWETDTDPAELATISLQNHYGSTSDIAPIGGDHATKPYGLTVQEVLKI